MQAESLDLVDTEYSACSVSACPSDRSIVACGLYQILQDQDAQVNEESPATKRVGGCLLSRMDDAGSLCVVRQNCSSFQLKLVSRHRLHRIETAAILDMAWWACRIS